MAGPRLWLVAKAWRLVEEEEGKEEKRKKRFFLNSFLN